MFLEITCHAGKAVPHLFDASAFIPDHESKLRKWS